MSLVLSEFFVNDQSIVWHPIVLEKLPKLAVPKSKNRRFKTPMVTLLGGAMKGYK